MRRVETISFLPLVYPLVFSDLDVEDAFLKPQWCIFRVNRGPSSCHGWVGG